MSNAKEPLLPEPWVHRGVLPPEQFDALELAAGSRVPLESLSDEERQGRLPTPRAIQALDRQWVKIQNMDTDAEVFLRIQGAEIPEQPSQRVSSVVIPFQPSKDLTGADLRSIPVQALTAAYSAHKDQGQAAWRRTLHLADAIKEDPLAPLPPASATDEFTARAARQYVALEEANPTESPIAEMVRINGAAKSSVQRWVARARKRGFLPPAIQGRRNG